MKDFTLEDMTKPELIKIIKQSQSYLPAQKVMRWIRWQSMCEQTQVIMNEAIKEQQLSTGKRDMESLAKYMKASEKFSKGIELGDKSDAFLEEIKEQRSGE